MPHATGMWFEEFIVGQVFESAGRTVTDTDITMFSMLSGDWNALHSDDVFASASRFGRRIGHGALGIALATGLLTRLGIFEGTAIAMLDLRDWSFLAPILIGDTLHLKLEIVSVKQSRSGKHGVVDRRLSLLDQCDQKIQSGYSGALIAGCPD